MPFPMTGAALLLASFLLPPLAGNGGTGAADAGSALRFRWSVAWNLHMANDAGAEHRNDRGEVTVELQPEGRVRVSDGGELKGSDLYADHFSETTTVWKTTWQGTRRTIGAKLRLELVRSDSSCETTTTTRWGATTYRPERTRCKGGRERLVLECERKTIKAGPADDLSGKTQPTPAWSCDGARITTSNGPVESGLPWVLGTERCLEQRGGGPMSGPFRYVRCGK